jgi:hypothetical protein
MFIRKLTTCNSSGGKLDLGFVLLKLEKRCSRLRLTTEFQCMDVRNDPIVSTSTGQIRADTGSAPVLLSQQDKRYCAALPQPNRTTLRKVVIP